MKRFVLPKKITWPGGFTIKIAIVDMNSDMAASWDYDLQGTGIIQMSKGLSQARQRYYLSHELIHAAVDYHHFMITQGGTT